MVELKNFYTLSDWDEYFMNMHDLKTYILKAVFLKYNWNQMGKKSQADKDETVFPSSLGLSSDH